MRIPLLVVVLLAASPAGAAELGLNFGYDDVFGRNGSGAASFGVQYLTDPLATLGVVGFGLGLAGEVDTEGDVWGGGGVTAGLPLGDAGVRVGVSFMVGGYALGNGGDDLGSGLEFRSRLGISAPVAAPWRVGLAIEHKSNAGLGDINPGVETLYVTLSRRF
ncbi:MAG TPA: acyloxyacyl hydrolase [Amaricoccus sp.]|nr:acyloxyacyl hydrolase [Amaricoccus sp.]